MKIEGVDRKESGRFALLRHEVPPNTPLQNLAAVGSHWDLVLEISESCEAWMERNGAELTPSNPDIPDKRRCEQLTTFRLRDLPRPQTTIEGGLSILEMELIHRHHPRFLGYEGELSPGKGKVIAIARGSYQLEIVEREDWCLRLKSPQLQAEMRIPKIQNNEKFWSARIIAWNAHRSA